MKNPTYEIRFFDIGAPLFIEKRADHRLAIIAFIVVAFVVSFAVNAWFEGLCPNGGSALTMEGILCTL